jgi:hypothetical protein
VKSALRIGGTLRIDPPAELEAVDFTAVRDAGMAVAIDVVQKSPEAFVPLLG